MVYAPRAPYELLCSRDLDYPAMQRLKRFARGLAFDDRHNLDGALHEWAKSDEVEALVVGDASQAVFHQIIRYAILGSPIQHGVIRFIEQHGTDPRGLQIEIDGVLPWKRAFLTSGASVAARGIQQATGD